MHASLVSTFLALSLLSTSSLASPHLSHARGLSNLHVGHGAELVKRLGSRGKGGPQRLNKRGNEAVLKCTSAKTFQLCDGDRCTDMGSVAAGTMCEDGAITWDTTSEASPEDSSSASASIAEFVSTKAQAVSSSIAVVEAAATDAAVHVKLNAVKTATPSFTTPGPSSTSSPSSSSSDDDEEDWECDTDVSEEQDTPSSASSSSTYTTSAAPQKTTQVQLNAQKPTTTQAPTTTSAAPVVQVSASVSVGGGSSGGGGETFTGRGTFYFQGGAAGSCGDYNPDSALIVALNYPQKPAEHCGDYVLITNTANGKQVKAKVADTCPGCGDGDLDLSTGAYDLIGARDTGVLPLKWSWA